MQSDEKKAIEKATAESFFKLYNQEMNRSYKIVKHDDSPDFRCEDAAGNKMNLEITLTEDRAGDIQASLGRSNQRSVEVLKGHLAKVKTGKASVFDRVSLLAENVIAMAGNRINAKLTKDYGPNTALVVRDTSGVDWDWDVEIENMKSMLDPSHNPYGRGIWIISNNKDRIFRIV